MRLNIVLHSRSVSTLAKMLIEFFDLEYFVLQEGAILLRGEGHQFILKSLSSEVASRIARYPDSFSYFLETQESFDALAARIEFLCYRAGLGKFVKESESFIVHDVDGRQWIFCYCPDPREINHEVVRKFQLEFCSWPGIMDLA